MLKLQRNKKNIKYLIALAVLGTVCWERQQRSRHSDWGFGTFSNILLCSYTIAAFHIESFTRRRHLGNPRHCTSVCVCRTQYACSLFMCILKAKALSSERWWWWFSFSSTFPFDSLSAHSTFYRSLSVHGCFRYFCLWHAVFLSKIHKRKDLRGKKRDRAGIERHELFW